MAAQVADEEIARVPGWLARLHCPDLCLSCHFCSPSGYLLFSHGMALPDALLQSVFSDYAQWSYESDFDGHEGMFYSCNATKQLNEEIGDLEQRVISREVRVLAGLYTKVTLEWMHVGACGNQAHVLTSLHCTCPLRAPTTYLCKWVSSYMRVQSRELASVWEQADCRSMSAHAAKRLDFDLHAELANGALHELLDALVEEVQPSLKWLAELDVTIALAEVSEQHSFSRPVLTEENVLRIDKGARVCFTGDRCRFLRVSADVRS